jgi:CheY-like chemotaxis protein
MNSAHLSEGQIHPIESAPDSIRILHVDDQRPFLDLTTEHLSHELDETTIITRTDPQAAVTYLEDNQVECIISDYQMGAMNGLEFHDEVQAYAAEVPFILFTGEGSETIASEALEAGVDSYLQKSPDVGNFSVLANRISLLVDQFHDNRQTQKLKQTYEVITKTSTDAFWIQDLSTDKTLYSDGIESFGYSPGIRKEGFEWWVNRIHPDDRDEAEELIEAKITDTTTEIETIDHGYTRFSHHYRWQTATGEYVNCASRGAIIYEDGEAVEMTGSMTKREQCG